MLWVIAFHPRDNELHATMITSNNNPPLQKQQTGGWLGSATSQIQAWSGILGLGKFTQDSTVQIVFLARLSEGRNSWEHHNCHPPFLGRQQSPSINNSSSCALSDWVKGGRGMCRAGVSASLAPWASWEAAVGKCFPISP